MIEPLQKTRRGPRKGDGGRPRLAISDDRDRLIVTFALWLMFNRGSKTILNAAEIKLIALLFDPNDEVELDAESERTRLRIGARNLAGSRSISFEGAEPRNTAAAPGNRQFLRSRVDGLRKKIEKNWPLVDPRRKLTKAAHLSQHEIDDALWLVAAFHAVDMLFAEAPGAGAIANTSLVNLGLSIPPVAARRIKNLFGEPQAPDFKP
ncbi:MAG: hypothetical protein ACR652_07585 [Methylocystis sp.]|uniref:hypothetical protein n=1 Tax=Methylocystis sp. TaxID=1911079 RepID=UPI003DA38110